MKARELMGMLGEQDNLKEEGEGKLIFEVYEMITKGKAWYELRSANGNLIAKSEFGVGADKELGKALGNCLKKF